VMALGALAEYPNMDLKIVPVGKWRTHEKKKVGNGVVKISWFDDFVFQ
jgi:hypothetical protein